MSANKLKFIILISVIFLLWFLGRYFSIDTEAIKRSLEKFPIFLSGIVFVVLYCLVTFFIWLAKDAFRFTAAVLFGSYLSTLFVFIAEIINAFILFKLARYLGRAFVENSFGDKYRGLDEKLGRIGFGWLFLFRAVPLIPFRFLDLAAGLTRISFKRYLAAVILGSPLRIFWLQYILAGVGKSIFNPQALYEYLGRNPALFILSLIYVLLIMSVAFKLRAKKTSCR